MWVQKYDYSALKLEFFESDYNEVKTFFTDKWLIFNSDIVKKTKWRTQDKKAWKEKIVEKALQRKQDELAKKFDIPMDRLLENKKATIQLIRKKINAINEKAKKSWDSIDMRDLKLIREMNKVELWEPTSVNRNDNVNTNKDTISFEDKELIDNYFKNKN